MASDDQNGSNKGSGDDDTMGEIGGLFGVESEKSGDDASEEGGDERRKADTSESGGEGDAESEEAREADETDEGEETSVEADAASEGDDETSEASSSETSSETSDEGGGTSETTSDGGDEKVEIPRELIENLAESDQVGDEAKEKLRGVLEDPGEVDDREELADQLHDLAEAVKEGDVSGDELSAAEGGSDEQDETFDDIGGAEQAEAEDVEEDDTEEELAGDPTLDADQEFGDEPDDAVGGVFSPGGGDDLDVGDDDMGGESYLDEDDLGDYEQSETSSTVYILAGVVVVLLAVVGYVVSQTETGTRLYHLFKGDLKQYERMQAKKKEEKLRKKMIENFPKFGTLTLSGKPKYARMKLDGQIWYGKTPESGEWKELRLTTPNTKFQNLDIEEKHELEVMAPGHKTKEWTLTEEKWNPVGESNIEHQKKIDVSLDPAGESLEEQKERQKEFMQRLKKDPENNFYGEVTIDTKPEGAKVIFDTEPLKNEDGEELKTPVTFSKFYVKNEKTGELEENKIRVDTPPDRGHKIQLRMPEEKGDYPKYVSPLERQMWRCEWKEESKRKQISDDAPLPKHCNYKFELSLDFDKLKDYIKQRKKRKKEIKQQTKEMKKKRKQIRKKQGME